MSNHKVTFSGTFRGYSGANVHVYVNGEELLHGDIWQTRNGPVWRTRDAAPIGEAAGREFDSLADAKKAVRASIRRMHEDQGVRP